MPDASLLVRKQAPLYHRKLGRCVGNITLGAMLVDNCTLHAVYELIGKDAARERNGTITQAHTAACACVISRTQSELGYPRH
jgi:hypothetical protein